MSDIETRALKLLNDVWEERGYPPDDGVNRKDLPSHEALCRAIERHEAYEQKVSDIVYAHVNATNETSADAWEKLKTLIIPAPKPDPLVEVMKKAGWADAVIDSCAPSLSAALKEHGLEIRPCE
jgi:hypothetical protein